MLKEDLEIDLMPAGCATTFPKKYEKSKVSVITGSLDSLLGSGSSGGSIQSSLDSFWDEDLNDLLHIYPTDEARGVKRKISASFIPEDCSEASEDKKKKYCDTHLPLNQKSQVFRNSLFNDYKVDKDIGDYSMSAPSGMKKNLKRKWENTQPNLADDFMDIPGTHSDTKRPSKKCHSRKTCKVDTGDEPECEVRNSERSLVDELMLELENIHIGPNPGNQNVLVEETTAPMLQRKNNVSNHTRTDLDSRDEAIPSLKKLADWTKNHWEEDQNKAMLDAYLNSSVVVRSLHMDISSTYHTCLREVFEKYGRIIYIGPPIKHTTVDGKCKFDTTIYFDSETAAIKALQEDHTRFGSSKNRVLHNLYADTETLDSNVTFGGKSGNKRLGIDKCNHRKHLNPPHYVQLVSLLLQSSN